jgi:hypothetical protein
LNRARFLQLFFAKLLYAEFQQRHSISGVWKNGKFTEEGDSAAV